MSSLSSSGSEFQSKGSPSTKHSSSQKTRLNDLSYDIKIWTDLSSILSQSTRLTDGRTDGQTDKILIARPRLHSMQRGKNRFASVSLSVCQCVCVCVHLWALSRSHFLIDFHC